MPFSVSFGDSPVAVAADGDLSKFLKPDVPFILKFLGDPASLARQTLGSVDSAGLDLTFTPNVAGTWDLGAAGNVTFGVKPMASVRVQIKAAGELFRFSQGPDDADQVPVTVPPGQAYVSIVFKVGLGVSAGASFSFGNLGVSPSIEDTNEFDLANHKLFPQDTLIFDAIRQAFESFILPFKSQGIDQMKEAEYLDFQFLGKLSLGLGLSYGVTNKLLAGRSTAEVQDSFQTPLGGAVVQVVPTLQAGASFAVSYTHEDSFRAVVGRHRSDSANAASLRLLRMDRSGLSTTETFGITLSAGATFTLQEKIGEVIERIATSAFAGMNDGPLKKAAIAGLVQAIRLGDKAVQRYVDEANKAVNKLLKETTEKKIELQLKQESVDTNTALFHLGFDFNQPGSLAGYEMAMRCDFAGAVREPGVTVEPRSYVENLFVQRSGVSFEFFDIFKAQEVTEYFRDSSVIYLGDGVFRLISKAGVTERMGVNGSENGCEVYFSAEALRNAGAREVTDLNVMLHFVLTDHTPNAARQTVRVLRGIGAADLQAAADAIEAQPDAAVQVSCQFARDVYGALDSDDYIDGKPAPLPHPADARNYVNFVNAVRLVVPPDQAEEDFLRFFAPFDSWVEFNRRKIDQEGSTIPPSRKNTGNLAVSVWPDRFISMATDRRALVQCYLVAAQQFMNLCDSLKHLGRELEPSATEENYAALLKCLEGIIHQNIPVFFIKPVLAAIFRAADASAARISVKAPDASAGGGFVIGFDALAAARPAVMSAV